MKKIALLFAVLVCITASAQEYGSIAINVVVPSLPNVPEDARASLETKMQQVATQYGLASNGLTDRFIMTAKVNVASKDVTPTTPVKITQKMEVTMFIGDVVDNKVYESVVLNVSGIGQSETQSMVKAFAQIKPSNPKLKAFVENAENKIVEYYSNNCQIILTEANTLTAQQKYDAAIAKLIAVPEVCKECYEKCMAKAIEVYQTMVEEEARERQKQIDQEGNILVQQARSAWTAKRDYASAEKALELLSKVDPMAEAQKDAQALLAEINHHLRNAEAARAKAAKEAAEKAEAKEQRDWDFKVRQYEDNVAMERQLQKDNTIIQREQIAAAREVGVEYAKHQPKSVTYNNIMVW